MAGDFRPSFVASQGACVLQSVHDDILTTSQLACDPTLASILARKGVVLLRSCQAILDLSHVARRVT
jgi:hypothetical protein